MSETLFTFTGIGTEWKIKIGELLSSDVKQQLENQLLHLVDDFDKTYSRFRTDSTVYELFEKKLSVRVPHYTQPLFNFYKQLFVLSDGLFTPCVGELLQDLGYNASYSLEPKKVTLPVPSFNSVELHDSVLSSAVPVLLDFGAAGKGYLVDLISNHLLSSGFTSFTVDGSGDIFHHSQQQLLVGLEHPINTATVLGRVKLKNNTSICSSASNRRAWDNYHHIVNPITKQSPKDIIATWVLADKTMVADGLATCLFMVNPEKLRRHFSFEYLIVYKDLSFDMSPECDIELFT